MSYATPEHMAAVFPDLDGRPERYIGTADGFMTAIVPGVVADGTPGLIVRLDLPDGRAVLAGTPLLELLTLLNEAAVGLGFQPGAFLLVGGEVEPPSTN